MTDDYDLTDRYEALEGNTLEDEWEDSDGPPEYYGTPDPQTIIEEVGQIWWMWHTKNADSNIQFEGDTMDVEE